IVLLVEHHQPQDIYEYYRAAELCMVTSLHDGMSLVAKEFVSARDDERGVLILSQFTGAARELPEAIIVNPYDTDQCAAALHMALAMPAAEQRTRIRLMRGLIQEFNVYRWAGRMLIDAAGMRRRDPSSRPSARDSRPRSPVIPACYSKTRDSPWRCITAERQASRAMRTGWPARCWSATAGRSASRPASGSSRSSPRARTKA